MSLCLKLVVGNAINDTKVCSLILQLNRAETCSKTGETLLFRYKVLQKFYSHAAFSKIQIMLSPQGCLFSLEMMKDFRLILILMLSLWIINAEII